MRLSVLTLIAMALCLRPAAADACSCVDGPSDLAENLTQARDSTSVIYLAEVLSIERGMNGRLARVKVLETFKGVVPVGHTPMVPTGGHGDCTFPFKVAKTYVIYGGGSYCSRTREIRDAKGDVELEWLRTGVLPPRPTALLRETVHCDACELWKIAPTLVGQSVSWDVATALSSSAPFWTVGSDRDATSRQVAVGRTSDGGTFELVQTPYFGTKETCRQRVVTRSCEGLKAVEISAPGEPPVACIRPGPEVELCNEERSRVARWGELEELNAACDWRDPVVGSCRLSETPKPLRERATRLSAVLRCSPEFARPSTAACVVVQAADAGR